MPDIEGTAKWCLQMVFDDGWWDLPVCLLVGFSLSIFVLVGLTRISVSGVARPYCID